MENSYFSCLGKINNYDSNENEKLKYLSISPKCISIFVAKDGNAVVISKEFLGEFYMYKVSIKRETLRVRTNINNVLNVGDKCMLSINKDAYYFLYPGGQKKYI